MSKGDKQALEFELEALIAKRDMYFAKIQRIFNYTKHFDNEEQVTAFKAEFHTIENVMKQFQDIVDKINVLSRKIDIKYEFNYSALDSAEQLYGHIREAYLGVLKKVDTPVYNTSNPQAQARLPKIELIEFSGDNRQWPLFIETFNSLVDSNPNLDEITKVHYLLASLKGSAQALCASIMPTAANYNLILRTLKDKYEDNRSLANVYLSQMFEFKSAHNESVGCLNSFLEKFDTAVNALKNLNIPDLSDYIIVSLALSKLDSQTRKYFEMNRDSLKFPTYSELLEFIKNQVKSLTHSLGVSSSSIKVNSKSKISTHTYVTSCQSDNSCPVCTHNHTLWQCDRFLKLTPANRFKIVKDKNLCLNCLSSKHKMLACKSKTLCKYCQKAHHSLLHFGKEEGKKPNPIQPNCNQQTKETESTDSSSITTSNFCSRSCLELESNMVTLLPTVVVKVRSSLGSLTQARFLVDTASQSNFITTDLCRKLGVLISRQHISVLGLGGNIQAVRGTTNINIVSRYKLEVEFSIAALVIDRISEKLPSTIVDLNSLGHLKGLELADNYFHEPGVIDGILGADLFPHILGTGRIEGGLGLPVAIETSLGFVVMGRAPTVESSSTMAQTFCSTLSGDSINKIVQRFWETEEVGGSMYMSSDDAACEEFYKATTTRDENGRYSVGLPFKKSTPNLGESYTLALNRFLSLEKKLLSNSQLREKYSEAFQDYLDQGHMSFIGVLDSTKLGFGYYVPHFPVIKDSSSTPLRIVFDSSAKTSNSLSLNDELYCGPKLQNDIQKVLLNFRLYEIAVVSDVRQMYRNILLRPEDRKYQRVLWRSSPEEELAVYEMNRVSFGLKTSPYLALRTVQQLALDETYRFPLAARCVSTDLYVDDVVSSISSLGDAKELFAQLVGLFNAGGFQLVKWSSNSEELLECIPKPLQVAEDINFDTAELSSSFLKVLGLQWSPVCDRFIFRVSLPSTMKCTKRRILSTIARIWDPLGFLSAVSLTAKLLIRELWMCRLEWDEVPPEHIRKKWYKFCDQLPQLESLSVPRHVGIFEDSGISIIGFADASQKGLGAMVYIISRGNGKTQTHLLCAKSKVAPIKVLTIARLELCAAVLLSKLLDYVIRSVAHRLDISHVIACTDSTVTLNWVSGSPHRWQTFVANRVSKIQSLISEKCWFHIDGKLNPADCLSRGMMPAELIEHTRWLSGPPWLMMPHSMWPIRKLDLHDCPAEEEKLIALSTLVVDEGPVDGLIAKTSSWTKLLHILVFILRFCRLLPNKSKIDTTDLATAEKVATRLVQGKHFSYDIQQLRERKKCSKALRQLTPFLDEEGLIRVGGRLGNSNLEFDQRHPYLLPKKDNFVDLLVCHVHERNLHTGAGLLTSLLRQKYWILSCRSLARKCVRQCNYCFKFRPRALSPIMADLPLVRIAEAKPFLHTGVDYGGPFKITITRKRGVRSQKAYICLFVCLVTKALHIELASDLSTLSFLHCLRRFLARRGPCKVIYSDRGTNFVGAKAKLDEIYQLIGSSEFENKFGENLASHGIEWKFNPPHAPHFGGIWEANMKCVKTHLYKAIGTQILSYEELSTVLTQIEALLNSRPLCWLSSDPNDPTALTPAHFLTLTPLDSLPIDSPFVENPNLLLRKNLMDHIVQSYWKRWHVMYLHELQCRLKWNTKDYPAKEGMLVIVQQDNVPPLHWPLGIIEKLYPGSDGTSRVALVKTRHGTYKRPVVRLCPLPSQ